MSDIASGSPDGSTHRKVEFGEDKNVTVREVLTPLVKEALKRLCQRRNLLVSGTKGEILRRLAHSYHGDLSAVVLDC